MATASTDHVLTIGGVKVHFPVKPYPSQLSMMDKVTIAKFTMMDRIMYLDLFLFKINTRLRRYTFITVLDLVQFSTYIS